MRREPGSAALLTVLAGGLLWAVGLTGVAVVTDVVLTSGRARTAADAAALAAMGAAPVAGGTGGSWEAADAAAAANGARLERCCGDASAWPPRAEVEVSATPASRFVRAWLPQLQARSAASARPRDLADRTMEGAQRLSARHR